MQYYHLAPGGASAPQTRGKGDPGSKYLQVPVDDVVLVDVVMYKGRQGKANCPLHIT